MSIFATLSRYGSEKIDGRLILPEFRTISCLQRIIENLQDDVTKQEVIEKLLFLAKAKRVFRLADDVNKVAHMKLMKSMNK